MDSLLVCLIIHAAGFILSWSIFFHNVIPSCISIYERCHSVTAINLSVYLIQTLNIYTGYMQS